MSTEDFYDALAPFYHLIYPDWEASSARQAAALDAVIRAELGNGAGRTVLDVACGIGTQALGMAALGYAVAASDLSAGAVRRLRDTAAARGLSIDAQVADMRAAGDAHGRMFDVVLCADNSLPHLLSDDEILAALRGFLRCTAPGGVCLVSIRDYAAVDWSARIHPHGVRQVDGTRWVLFQVWEPRPPLYETTLYVMEDRPGAEIRTQAMRATYYALPVERLVELMREAGFTDVRRMDGAFFQPLVVGRRAVEG
ncbi:MAG TPA: class I SAM-dependent methyltransferase [Longimicrobium sp.]|jgi:SAM-dependent methyltransferase|nr:class I SAM-dependent methyltransferase [Longimicrobium sp.]